MTANEPTTSPRGRSLFRLVAVLLALGVLGYLMWRSQANATVAPPASKEVPGFTDPGRFTTPLEPHTPPVVMPPGLSSSKSIVLDPEPKPVVQPPAEPGQSPAAQPPQTTPR